MGFLDKLKEAGQQAASRAMEELDEFQKKRDITQAYTELGKKAYDLAEGGQLSHESLTADVDGIRKLKAELAEIEAAQKEAASTSTKPPPESS